MEEFQETATTKEEEYKSGSSSCGKCLFINNKCIVVVVGHFRRGASCTG